MNGEVKRAVDAVFCWPSMGWAGEIILEELRRLEAETADWKVRYTKLARVGMNALADVATKGEDDEGKRE